MIEQVLKVCLGCSIAAMVACEFFMGRLTNELVRLIEAVPCQKGLSKKESSKFESITVQPLFRRAVLTFHAIGKLMKFTSISALSAALLVASISLGMAEEAKPAEKAVEEAKDNAKVSRTDADFKAIAAALQQYKLTTGDYPTEEQGLKVLVEIPRTPPTPKRWIKLMSAVPKDAWGRDYRYVVRVKDKKKETLLLSDGPDAKDKKDDLEFVVTSVAAEKK
ncbi:type II secretion system protein GspG [Haloferula sp. BvORR071]|uniref:type II secretion system protein GspG n=1 Tax=Haloferula sp. BvORR071 TaxID=1396141 RepID=UPI0006986AD1|nr:type II secretion system protein GspG [Haloferula sp. BvORR071]